MTLYLSKEHLTFLRPSWVTFIQLIESSLDAQSQGDYAQPIKPYLRYNNPINRIIAMPAFIGGNFNQAGIKWIASFPDNLKMNLPRAHSTTILNDYQTGKPVAILSSSELSGLRTAAVSGYILNRFLNGFLPRKIKVGITGYGPIGRLHAEMVSEILKDRLDKISIYDVRRDAITFEDCPRYEFVDTWQDAYLNADIFIPCTTAQARYINLAPKVGSLQLNVSLRDYYPDVVIGSSSIIVDDWHEVCRENTDIEKAHLEYGLQERQTISLHALLNEKTRNQIGNRQHSQKGYISCHCMGMAIFDMAIGSFYYREAISKGVGIPLPD